MTLTSPGLDVLATIPKQLFVGGAWVPATGGDTMGVQDPATEAELCQVADAGPEDGGAALRAAVAAQPAWAATAPRERGEILRRAYEAIVVCADELALVITLEMGKPVAEARGEVLYAAEFFRWFAEEAVRIDGGYTQTPDGRNRVLVMKQPVGPCLLITPWNFPLAMGTRKIGPAIAAGCTMVLKPAPQTPLASLALAQILADCGLPNGVLNVVTTSRAGELVEPMLRSGEVRKLSFTGSTAVGRTLLAQCADTVVRTSLELGGNAPFIVFPDADLDVAVDAAVQAKMRNMGEACTAANRFYVHADVADAFGERLAGRLAALKVGPGVEAGSEVGPLIDASGVGKARRLMDDAVARGARVLSGGRRSDGPGYFFEPTVITDVQPGSELLDAEIFGPVAALQTFTDTDDVLTRANDTEWGLVGYVMTQDVDRALHVAERLRVGMVGLNTGVVSTPAAPFGGVKQSGLGREGGRLGIEEYLDVKYVAIPIRQPRAS
jgi:succinate-semialdehyde dehydrogenase / glutarate-semialdehyde dehydrogenase